VKHNNPSPAGEGRVRGNQKRLNAYLILLSPCPLHQERGESFSDLRFLELLKVTTIKALTEKRALYLVFALC